jgi:ATP-dependent helicase/nuclease subunit B
MIETFSADDPAMGVACLERYRELLAEPDACAQPGLLWLVPTPRRERQMLEGLRPAGGRALFGAGVQTFEQLAEVILASAGASGKLISPAMQRVILRRVIARRLAAGELTYFRSIAGTSGFTDVVAEWISELKRGETWPDDLARALGRSRRGEGDSRQQRDEELLQIYGDYQAQLEQRDWYDYEGRFWRARTLLTGGETHFQQFRLVVLDGFSSLSATQIEIAAWLIEHSQGTMVGWPGRVDDRGLPEFHGPKQLLKQLETHLANRPVFKPLAVVRAINRPERPNGLSLVQRQLFNETAVDRVGRDASGVSIQMLAGQEGERSHVARQVKTWLQNGTRPSEIVVAVRSLDTDGEALFQACQSAGVPVHLDQPPRLSRSAMVRAIRGVLRLEAGDWAFSELQRVLDHSLVRPMWKTAESITETLSVLRQLQLHEGREVILKVVDRQAARYSDMASVGDVPVPASGSRVMTARRVLQSLSDTLKPLRGKRTLEEWVNVLDGIVADLCLLGRGAVGDSSPSEAAQDRGDWELFQRILRDAADAEGVDGTRLELPQLLADIEDLLRIERMPRRPQPKERVAIVDVKQAQHLRVKCLLLPGLVESSFPQRGGDNCLYSEGERASLNERGVALRVSTDRVADEQLLFYRLMSVAQEELVLCYAAIDQRGQGVFPSPYLTAVEQLFEKGVLPIESVGQLDPVPQLEAMTLRSELRLATVRRGLEGDAGPLREVLNDGRFAGWSYRLEGQLELGISRFETTGWTAYEGDCSSPLALTELTRRYPGNHEFSVSQFEQYASCPFQFFAQRLLGIEPLGDVQPGGSALERGIHLHEVLSRIDFETLHAHLDSEAIHSQLTELLDGYFSSHGGGTRLQGALLRIERRLLDAYSSRFGLSQVEFAKQLSTILDGRAKESLTELAFGRLPGEASVGTGTINQAGLPAIQFGNVGEVVHVCGKVDRIDVFETAGEKSFVIIDYKAGNVRKKRFDLEAIASGQSLQMIVYLLALKRLEVFGADARPAMMIYWGLGDEGPVGGFKRGQRDAGLVPLEAEILAELEALVDEVLPRLVLGIRQGLFTVSPQQKDCTQYCDYRHACRIAQVRSVGGVLGKVGFNG